MRHAATVALFLCSACASAQNGAPVQLVYLTVGVGEYADPPEAPPLPNTTAFEPTNGPWSAFRVSEALGARGAEYGIELVGGEGAYVRRQDVVDALERVIARARSLPRPLIVYYFSGHGISEGIGWNLFSVPGDFVGPFPVRDIDQASEEYLLSAAEVIDRLEASGVPFLVLFDHCYEGDEETFENDVLTSEATQSLRDVAGVVRFRNEFHTDYPVLFSTEPGTLVPEVPDPFENGVVGPLARRLLLALDRLGEGPVRLDSLVDLLTGRAPGPPLDDLTKPALSFVERPMPALILAPVGEEAPFEERSGTGRGANLTPYTGSTGPSSPEASEELPPPRLLRLWLEGTAGDFVTEGQTYDLTFGPEEVTTYSLEAGRSVSLLFEQGENWGMVGVEAPAVGSLQAGTAVEAVRYDPKDDSWGFEVGLNGRGCNEQQARITVKRAVWEPPGGPALTVVFEQSCDRGPPARGRLEAVW